ncbi:MAG TPA: type II secretion system F family protein [Thermoanaerobaculia bacterium]|nr:type II secretion system F family protein [Thermoanaerobaculia bacterium]
MSALLLFTIFALLAVAATMFVYNAMPDFQQINLSKRFTDELGAGRTPPNLIKMFRLPILMLTDLASGLQLPKTRERYENDLRALGLEKVISLDQLIALKLTVFFISCLYALMLLVMLPIFFCVALPFLGWVYVDIWLKDRIKKRKVEIKRQLPFLLDMLTLSVEAGMEFTAAVNKIVSKMAPSALREELTIFLRQMQLGMSRREALKAMAERVDLIQINSMVSALIQASEMGASIGGALRTQSEILNSERFTEAEKKGAEASQKMLFPMVIFIIPAVLLIIIGPLVIQFIHGGGGGL